jgi:cell wall-associated NlpC family hydrolase
MAALDRRIIPARPDLAAKFLEGEVPAERFVAGTVMEVAHRTAPLRNAPAEDSLLDTELLFGERFTVYEERAGWAWGQAEIDSYVGYVPAAALSAPAGAATHRVTALASHLYPAAEVKAPPLSGLSFGARLLVVGEGARFAAVETAAGPGFVPARHLTPVGVWAPDFVAVAERFLGAPYLWGGRTGAGLDCSALVQLSLAETGRALPRDSDQQQQLGTRLGTAAIASLQRGDLLFWANHVAIALDARRLVHANGSAMAVSIDDAHEFAQRIAASDGPILDINRL